MSPQFGQKSHFSDCELKFDNDFALLESEVARAFPDQIDGFSALAREVREIDALTWVRFLVYQEAVRRHINDPLLEDMIFCPVMYYGSAEEQDMDYGQFSIMFRSLFFRDLPAHDGYESSSDCYKTSFELGGLRKMKCGVRRIVAEETARPHLSSIGGIHHSRQGHFNSRRGRDRAPALRSIEHGFSKQHRPAQLHRNDHSI